MSAPLILAIDQGTTGTTALLVTPQGETVARHNCEFPQHFPHPGWVEHEPAEIWKSVAEAVRGALAKAGAVPSNISAIGITNQRETTVVWERDTLTPIARAIVWQCRRTADTCAALSAEGAGELVRKRTGLVLDAYFSGTKIAWILDHVAGARARAERGELAFGTIDTFLVAKLTGGAVHVTDVSNASRTLLFGLESLTWDDEMCRLFRVPSAVLPKVVGNAEVVGHTRGLDFLPDGIPIAGMAGDQQAALFGQACFAPGDGKCTYGTGAFALVNIGETPTFSQHGLVTTVGWRVGGKVTYALEGSAFVAGAMVQWLRDGLGMIKSASEIEALAAEVATVEGVVVVPALAGLGAPHWDPHARGAILGLTRGSKRAHIARAALEGIAFQVCDLLRAMVQDAPKHPLRRLRVDGGAAANNLLMQFQSDIAQVKVERPTELESTGRGAAMLAGIGVGLVTLEQAGQMVRLDREFAPAMNAEGAEAHLARWRAGVARVRSGQA
jgi:glycerol kinase